MFKKVLSLCLVITLMFSFVGCSSKDKNTNSTTVSVDKDAKEKIQKALDKLKAYEGDYIISNILEAPDGTANYLDVKTSNGSYSEYPVQNEDSSEEATDDSNLTSYTLVDWLTTDNNYYIIVADEENNSVFAKCPSDYANLCSSRNYMYVDKMLDKFTSIKYYDTITGDIGNGSETIELYKCELPSSTVSEILGVGTIGLYSSIKNNYKDNDDIQTFCDYYLKDLGMSMTFSDAIVTIGISDGMLKYSSIEVGGLGTRLYDTRAIITSNVNVRDIPDLSQSVDYITTIQDYASYIASFDSYEDALKAMNEGTSEDDNNILTDTEEAESETKVE